MRFLVDTHVLLAMLDLGDAPLRPDMKAAMAKPDAVTLVSVASLWEIAGALAANQGVKRGYLGIGIQPVRLPERQRAGRGERGVLIVSMAPGGAADRTGLLVGDVVVGFNEQPIEDADDLQDALAATAPDASAALDVLRGGVLQRVTVVVGERPRE